LIDQTEKNLAEEERLMQTEKSISQQENKEEKDEQEELVQIDE
jgi:hypothetical protein